MSDHSLNANRGVYHGGTAASATTTDSGILRKLPQQHHNVATEKSFDDLLIFGYACKIFRDDEKARYIDQGKHLIPWMGDNSLKIDRYDVRGALMDISQYEPPPGGFQNRLDCLSSPERKAEQLCEQERYYSLYNNDVEEEFYQEEELKRLRSQVGADNYAQVAFNYDADSATVADNDDSSEKPGDESEETPDEIYVPHPKFIIPVGMVLPETTKLHAIIEKTAKFIAGQGPQMEILIKAKQSNNPQFEFLNLNSRLNPFYKHALQSMRNGTYPFGPPPPPEGTNNLDDGKEDSTHSESSMSAYFRSSLSYPSLQMPTIKYKPSADCAYTQLISKIKGVPLPADVDASPGSASQTATEFDYSAYYSSNTNTSSGTSTPIPVRNNYDQPLVPAIIDQEKVANKLKTISKDGVVVKAMSTGLMLAQYYNSDSDTDHDEENDKDENDKNEKDKNDKVLKQSAEKKSEIETAVLPETLITTPPVDVTKLGFACPPEDLRNMIDKTAAYVLKNGKEFEDILRSKNDERFKFLHYTDQYNPYYMYKVTGVVRPQIVQNMPSVDHTNGSQSSAIACYSPLRRNAETSKPTASILPISKTMPPVSFAIKPKEEPSVALRPALPQEVSDSEEESPNVRNDGGTDQKQTKQPIPLPIKTVSALIREAVKPTTPPLPFKTDMKILLANKSESYQTTPMDDLNDSSIRDMLFEQSTVATADEKKEAKRADDKVRDRLAQIAREKLGILSKEKQLQIERKKRAMAFLNNMKEPTADASSAKLSSNADSTLPQSTKTTASVTCSVAESTISEKSTKPEDVKLICESSNSSSDSVTFINIIPSTTSRKNLRRPRSNEKDDDSDDVIEITPRERRSRSRSRSRSAKQKHKHSKHRKKSKTKSKRSSRSRSRSRSSRADRRSADYDKNRKHSAKSKKRRRRSSSD